MRAGQDGDVLLPFFDFGYLVRRKSPYRQEFIEFLLAHGMLFRHAQNLLHVPVHPHFFHQPAA